MQNHGRRDHAVAAVAGAVTGAAAGFVGVGGGEFRIPVLVSLLRLPLKLAGGVNLVVGLFTVALGVMRRWGQVPLTRDDVLLVAVMAAVSIIGASIGVRGRDWMAARPLKIIFCGYLLVAGVWMIYESVTAAEHVILQPEGWTRWTLAAVVAFVIAVISGVLGIAGGEMRIPALLYLFGVPIVAAGTLSLAVSVPTVAAAAFTDRRMGGIPNDVVGLALVMGLASATGVLIGAALVPYADPHVIKGTLGMILLLATVRLTTSSRTDA